MGLAKAVGLVAKVEVDVSTDVKEPNILEKSPTKMTINIFDQEIMPVIEDLYQHDQSASLEQMKQQGNQEEMDQIFDQFITSVEDSVQ